MIFGRKKKDYEEEDHEEDDLLEEEFEEEEELETVLFQGALYGREANLSDNEGLVRAALMPVKELVSDAIDRRAERLVIEPRKGGSIVRLDIDGVGYAGAKYPAKQALGVTQMIKVLAGLDSKIRNKKQTGGIKAEFMGKPYLLTVDSVPTQLGAERITMKIKNLKEQMHTPVSMGISEELRAKMRDLGSQREGVFLVCGPSGSGVTTALHGSILCVDLYLHTIFNMQKHLDVEEVPGLSEFEYDSELDLDTNILKASRKEADGGLIEPLKTAEQAKAALSNCDSMTLYTELAAPNAAAGLKKLAEMVGDPKLVTQKVKGVLCPRLIRKLREDVKEAYRPNPKIIQRLGLPPETNILYRPPTASIDDEPAYEGLPYEGRTAIFELIEMTDEIKEMLISGADEKSIRQKAKDLGMPTHQQGAVDLVAQGVTSLEELQRIFKS